jgi:pilus assembly protein CpaB
LKRRVLSIVLAAILAVVGAGAVLVYVHQANNRAVAGLKTETVLQASANIPAGTPLGQAWSGKMLKQVQLPVAYLAANPVQVVTPENRNMVMSGVVPSGELLLQSMLTTVSKLVASGSVVPPPGMAAVPLRICLTQDVAGYVTAGSYVAIYDAFPAKGKGNGSSTLAQSCDVSHPVEPVGAVLSQMVLRRVLVLAVGQAAASAQTTSGIGSTATNSATQSDGGVTLVLAVPESAVPRVQLLDQVGLPYLALLSSSSTTVTSVPEQLLP